MTDVSSGGSLVGLRLSLVGSDALSRYCIRIKLNCRISSCVAELLGDGGGDTHIITGARIFKWRTHRTAENLIYSFTISVDYHNIVTASIYRTPTPFRHYIKPYIWIISFLQLYGETVHDSCHILEKPSYMGLK